MVSFECFFDVFPNVYFVSNFFNIFARITNLLFFNPIGYLIYIISFTLIFRYNYNFFHHLALGRLGLMDLPLSLQVFTVLNFLIFYIVILLTVLAYSPKIQEYMKKKYGDTIMKELHYNDPKSSLIAALTVPVVAVVTAGIAEVGENKRCQMLLDAYREVAAECIKNGQPVPQLPSCNVFVGPSR